MLASAASVIRSISTSITASRTVSRTASIVPSVGAAAIAAAIVVGAHVPVLGAQTPSTHAMSAAPARDTRVQLVVFVTVDQLIPAYFARYGRQFTGGFARLAREGTLYVEGYHDHATTETAPGHASLLSGRFPRSTNIVRNNVGVPDRNAPLVGGGGPGASPFRFRGTTLADWMRTADPRARILSISRKDRGAIMPVGRMKDASVFWYVNDGRFTTSTWYADTLPTWLQRFNARRVPQSYAGTAWTLLRPVAQYAEADSVAVESNGSDLVFPHVLPADTARATAALPGDPRMDDLTLQAALAGADAMQLGRTAGRTDLLAVSLSTTDAVGHRYGPESREIHDHLLRLDRALGAFLDSLARTVPASRTIVALSSDHGVQSFPELRFRDSAGAALRIDVEPALTRAQSALRARGVDGALGLDFEYGMVFADSAAFAQAKLPMDSVLRDIAARARVVPGVARVDFVADLAKADTTRDVIARRWLHALPSDLGVRLVVTPKPGVYWRGVMYATHGSPNDDDARVPIAFMGPGFARGRRITRTVRTVDIAPTLARRLGIVPGERVDGTVLTDALAPTRR